RGGDQPALRGGGRGGDGQEDDHDHSVQGDVHPAHLAVIGDEHDVFEQHALVRQLVLVGGVDFDGVVAFVDRFAAADGDVAPQELAGACAHFSAPLMLAIMTAS